MRIILFSSLERYDNCAGLGVVEAHLRLYVFVATIKDIIFIQIKIPCFVAFVLYYYNSELKSKVKTVQYSGKEDESISSYSSTSVSNYSNDGESKTRVIQQAQRLSPKQKGSPRQAQFVTKEYLKDAPKPTQKVAIKRTVTAQKKGSVMKGIQNKYDSTVI
ncbi:Hypothetical_protein [Hexamita inflata]|uniref:Hypothetical_protein n=1 Tax=Hexamita inflata TaxID=28002 RepID=A0AA86P347_9EUKA|nr:Hypothetical protein HINF_LOCUS18634 [Hexamita inflata]